MLQAALGVGCLALCTIFLGEKLNFSSRGKHESVSFFRFLRLLNYVVVFGERLRPSLFKQPSSPSATHHAIPRFRRIFTCRGPRMERVPGIRAAAWAPRTCARPLPLSN